MKEFNPLRDWIELVEGRRMEFLVMRGELRTSWDNPVPDISEISNYLSYFLIYLDVFWFTGCVNENKPFINNHNHFQFPL